MSEHLAPFPAPIALLTDFGLSDGYVGVMKGVIVGLTPGVPFIDISHAVAPQDISAGAWMLGTSYRYFPRGTVFLCVVDPGVGSERQPMAMQAGEWFFVGPNNGLFSFILQEQTVREAVVLANPAYQLPQVSATFQGRDIFSPAAAALARAVPLADLGPALPASSLMRLDIRPVHVEDGRIHAQVVSIDHFGNLITTIPARLLPDFFGYSSVELVFVQTQANVSQRRRFFAAATGDPELDRLPFIYIDSSGFLAVAVQNGNAASGLRVAVGEPVNLVYNV